LPKTAERQTERQTEKSSLHLQTTSHIAQMTIRTEAKPPKN